MTPNNPTVQRSLPKALVALVLSSLIVKLLLIGWNRGEYTDGIIQLELRKIPVVFFPPLYTVLVQMFNLLIGNLVIAGRLVSILASSLVPIPLFLIGKRLGSERVGLLASLLWVLSPMQNRWGLRVMTDSLFTFVFVIALLYFIRAVLDRREAGDRALRGMFFWAGVATLVRYHGLVFLPLTLPILRWRILFRPRGSESENSQVRLSWPLPLALIPWGGAVAWVLYRGFGHLGQFTERAGHGLLITTLSYYDHLETYVLYMPWAVGYPLAAYAIYAVIRLWRRRGPWGLLRAVTVLTLLIWLVVQTAFQSFQFRYFLPLLPLWCLMAGYGLDQLKEERGITARARRVGVAVTLCWLTGMSVLVVGLQRNAFADITDAAVFVSQRPTGERVFSNEVYREGVEAVKMSFWSGRPVLGVGSFKLLRPGDLVAVHNVYGNVATDLSNRFTYEVVFRSRRYLYPLLPDIMVFPPGSTSHPIAMAFRFTPQSYETVVVRITGRRDSTVRSP